LKLHEAKACGVCLTTTCLLVLTLILANARSNAATIALQVNGVVTDSAGLPIEHARVTLKQTGRTIASTDTNSKGEFALTIADATRLTVLVELEGFAAYEHPLGEPIGSLRIQLSPANVSASVTVAATRTTTPLSEVAASVTTLNASDLNSTAALTLDDTLRQVPGFSLFRHSGSRTENPTSQGVSLRGVGASGASRAVVLADGVPLNDPFGGWIYWDRVPREAISDAEGSRTSVTRYGSSSPGGVIDISTVATAIRAVARHFNGNEESGDGSIFCRAKDAAGQEVSADLLAPRGTSSLVMSSRNR
jgi:outer membrane receptor protein involved in Fe transport